MASLNADKGLTHPHCRRREKNTHTHTHTHTHSSASTEPHHRTLWCFSDGEACGDSDFCEKSFQHKFLNIVKPRHTYWRSEMMGNLCIK